MHAGRQHLILDQCGRLLKELFLACECRAPSRDNGGATPSASAHAVLPYRALSEHIRLCMDAMYAEIAQRNM